MSLLDSLPPGAVFTAQRGASRVLVSSDKPPDGLPRQIMIVATCDSLEEHIRILEEELQREQATSSARAEQKKEEHPPAGVNLRGIIIALIVGLIGGWLLRRKLLE